MNSDSFSVIGNRFPTAHVFNVANIATSIGLTETAFSFTNSGGAVAAVTIPQQSDIRGASTIFDPDANAAQTGPQFGRISPYYALGRPWITTGTFDGSGFRLRAMGKASFTAGGAGATTFTVNLYQGSSATLGSDVKIASPTAVSVAANKIALVNFVVECSVVWDASTQVLFGEFWATIAGNVDVGGANTKSQQYTSRGALTNSPTVTTVAGLSFIPSVAFGTTAPVAAGTVTLQELSIEKM